MNEKFRGKYRIPSARAQWWDYQNDGAYFITICTKNRESYLGDIINKKMVLSTAGHIAEQLWKEIVNHTTNVGLHEFVIMPNHVHGIIVINNGDGDGCCCCRDKACLVSTDMDMDTDMNTDMDITDTPIPAPTVEASLLPGQLRFRNPGKNSLSSIIGGYKSAVTKKCNEIHCDFAWQPRFYDRIIRDMGEYVRIAEYIVNNPINWETDTLRIY